MMLPLNPSYWENCVKTIRALKKLAESGLSGLASTTSLALFSLGSGCCFLSACLSVPIYIPPPFPKPCKQAGEGWDVCIHAYCPWGSRPWHDWWGTEISEQSHGDSLCSNHLPWFEMGGLVSFSFLSSRAGFSLLPHRHLRAGEKLHGEVLKRYGIDLRCS